MLVGAHATIEVEDATKDPATFTALIEPGSFRLAEEDIATRPGCALEVLALAAEDVAPSAVHAGAGGGDSEPEGEAPPEPVARSTRAAAAAAAASDETSASARGTGMTVTRVTVPGRRLACHTCGEEFEDAAAHRTHFRSDFHRYNQKRKMASQPCVTAAEYDALSPAERSAVLDAIE